MDTPFAELELLASYQKGFALATALMTAARFLVANRKPVCHMTPDMTTAAPDGPTLLGGRS